MKKRINYFWSITYYLSLVVAIVLFIVSTVVVIINKPNIKTTNFNANKTYNLNNYQELIEDINAFNKDNEGLYFCSRDTAYMQLNENREILILQLTFVNESKTKMYQINMHDNENSFLIFEYPSTEFDLAISLDEYFYVCYLGVQKIDNIGLYIYFSKDYFKEEILDSDRFSDDFIYEENELKKITQEIQGPFYTFNFQDSDYNAYLPIFKVYVVF